MRRQAPSDVLSSLALTSPTLLQLQLLRSADAVNHFVRHYGRRSGSHLDELALEDDTRAALAQLNPNESQLALLRTEGAVRAYVARALGGRCGDGEGSGAAGESVVDVDFNAIRNLYQIAAPAQPSFRWLSATSAGYSAEYRVGNHVGTGCGETKRLAKARAANALYRFLTVPQRTDDGGPSC